ncbi:TIGR03668 family PPOX class F420-dependent oxidoreductase [Nocardia sp. CNY236]|uniref:TIGR03668 family PPOX class F420-dependent oxidoreductase n=1 Tax=Nocardia sp. CNY236 TaxID=1169152 RepID=UPI0004066CA0|nr:TIGR03668 family PPOX class F420-dependent oxidoreductase [Nocardia sp. CNY236]
MRLSTGEAYRRFTASPVARLATVSAAARPHLVPVVFAVVTEVIYTAVDSKPKTTTALRRLANIAANPAVTVLADRYDDDWSNLWWVRADGDARIAGAAEADLAKQRLAARYPAYRHQPPPGPVIAIDVERWSGWCADERSHRPG